MAASRGCGNGASLLVGTTGPSPVGSARTGSKHRLVTQDRDTGAVSATGRAPRRITRLMPMIQGLPRARVVLALRARGCAILVIPCSSPDRLAVADGHRRAGRAV